MGFFNNMIKESNNILHELEINGEKQEDDTDTPDYTGGDDADNDTPDADNDTPDADNDTPDYTKDDDGEARQDGDDGQTGDDGTDDVDYTVPDDAAPDNESDQDINANDTNVDTDNSTDTDTPDYTQDDGSDNNNTEGDSGETQQDGDDGADDVDYTQDDDGSGDDGTTDDNSDDTTGDDSDGSSGEGADSDLKNDENNILADLSDKQKQIQSDELRINFIEMYNLVLDTIDKVNNVSKREDTLEIFEFISSQLLYLKDIINTNITRTFNTKTYFENNVSFQQCLAILNSVKKLIDETNKKVESSKN